MKLRHALTAEEIALGFDSSTDIFHQKDLAARITTLFGNLQGGSVCLLDGRWGTGKSTFVKQWSAELRKSGASSIYFDAFASDYIDTPFTALAGIFVKAAYDAKKSDDPSVKKFIDKAAKVGKALAATTAKVGLKAVTLGAMDGSEIDGLAGAIADGLGEIAEASVKKLLDEHAERESQFEAMRSAIAELASAIVNDDGERAQPLLVFIDELDRCRPDFSLGILEILKHFFNVDGVHFVLVTSKSYLELAVRGKYGLGDLSGEYLEKFYDFIVLFEQNYEKNSEGSVRAFIDLTLDRFIPVNTQESFDFKEYIKEYCMSYRLTLRQSENVCINSCIAYLSVKDTKVFKPGYLIAFGSVIKAINLPLYRKMRDGSLSWGEARDFIESADWNGSYGERLKTVVRWHLDPDVDIYAEEWKNFGGNYWQYNIDRLSILKYVSNNIIERFSGPRTDNM